MRKFRNALLITFGILTVLCLGFVALAYVPSPKFESVAPEHGRQYGIEVVEAGMTGQYKYSGIQQ